MFRFYIYIIHTLNFLTMQVTKCGRNDDQVLKELERRQEAILEKLASLKLQVSTLKGDKHVAITQVLKRVLDNFPSKLKLVLCCNAARMKL